MAQGIGLQKSENFSQLTDFDPVLTEIFYQHLGQPDAVVGSLFRILDSNKAKETDLRVGSFGDPQEFKGQIEYHGVDPDYEIEYSHTEFADGFKVERKQADDMQYDNIFQRAEEMGTAFGRKVEKDAAAVFNNAFATVTGYDSKTLCADDHPRSSTVSTSVDNKAALALNAANLDTVRIQGQALVDDTGNLINWNGNLLLVPPALMKTAHELTASPLDPASAQNAANPYVGLQYMVWPRLTSATSWFLIDTQLMKRYLKWYWRVRPEFGAVEDFDTFQRKYRGYMRYSYGWSDFRWVVGSTV